MIFFDNLAKNIFMYKIAAFLSFFMLVTVYSQTNNDAVYVNYSLFPTQKMDEYNQKASLQIVEANLILPEFNLGQKVKVYTNLNYKNSFYNYENESDFYPEKLNDLRVGFFGRYSYSENLEFIISPRINIRSDFSREFGSKDVFPSLNGIGLRRSTENPNLIYGFGITYNNDLNKDVVLPLLYLKYTNDWVRVYAILPSFAYVILTPIEKFEYGLSYNLDASIFNIQRFDASQSNNYLKTMNITLAPTIGYNFYKDFWLNTKVGCSGFRDYRFLDNQFEEYYSNDENRLSISLYVNMGISLRMD